MSNRILTFEEEWYVLASRIISGEQSELEEIMLNQMEEFTGEKVTLDNLTVKQIAGWLVDCQEEIQPFIK